MELSTLVMKTVQGKLNEVMMMFGLVYFPTLFSLCKFPNLVVLVEYITNLYFVILIK